MSRAGATASAAPGRARAVPPARKDHFAGLLAPLVFVLAHAVFGVVLTSNPSLATIHAALVVLVTIWAAFLSPRLELALWAAGYVASCDVLWRMTEARVPWELNKYLLILVTGAGFLRHCRGWRHGAGPTVYLLLLVPSSFLTLTHFSPSEAREMMSSHLAGPVALGMAVLMFRQVIADEHDVARLFWLTLGPIATVTGIASWTTATTPNLEFGDESNFAASGGYGPNQVSTIMGFGALICLLLALLPGVRRARVIQLVVGAWMLGQAYLTFSRGGVYALVIATCGMGIVGLLSSGGRSRALVGGAVAFLVVVGLYSWADGYTGGGLDNRYDDTSTTHRNELVEGDLTLFAENPVFGVGPGRSPLLRPQQNGTSTHTEYSRLLAEHGMFGVLAIVLLITFGVQSYRWALGPWNRLLVAGMGLWGLATMSHAATRISLVSLAFGLMSLRVHVSPVLQDAAHPVFVLRTHARRSQQGIESPDAVSAGPAPAAGVP